MLHQLPPQGNQSPYPQPLFPPSGEQMVKTSTSGFGGAAEKKFSKDAVKLAKQG